MSKHNYHDFLAFMGVGGAHPGGLALTKELLKNISINQNFKVLDAGCGTGQTAAYIAKNYDCHVTAIDRHPMMLQKAKDKCGKNSLNVEFIQGDIEDMPFAHESFDFIIAESVTVFTNIDKTASEYARLLKKGGTLLDLEMTAIPPFPEEMLQAFQRVYDINHIPTEKEWKHKYKQAGFHAFEIIHGNSVGESLIAQPLKTDNEATDFLPSNAIDPAIYQI